MAHSTKHLVEHIRSYISIVAQVHLRGLEFELIVIRIVLELRSLRTLPFIDGRPAGFRAILNELLHKADASHKADVFKIFRACNRPL